jgi:DNA-binding NtrC family response regulator
MNARSRVLVVDDKDNMRALLRDVLTGTCHVEVATDGAAARRALESAAFELVLSDVRMPGIDGFELVRLVRSRWPDTEVVLMTAYASIPAAVDAIRQGAYDYIQKPFDPDDVLLVVSRALERQRERTAAAHTGPTEPELASLSYREALASARDRGSHEYLTALLRTFGGNVSRAAERAGLERESLHRLLRRYGIHADDFRNTQGPPAPTAGQKDGS